MRRPRRDPRPRWVLALVALCAALLVGPGLGTAVAAESTTYTLSGAEYAFTPTKGSFAGVAITSGQRGLFNAVVLHDPLNSGETPTPITGGSFTISGTSPVSGEFTGGSITRTSSPPGCRNELFDVTGPLATAKGAGSFSATLTHYQTLLAGRCLTYFARVQGQATVPK